MITSAASGWPGDPAGGAEAGRRGGPPTLPLVMNAQEFGLPLDKLRDFMLRDPLRIREPVYSADAPGMTGFFDPLAGVACGRRLAARIGSLLSRPACRFSHAFTWRSARGASLDAHRDKTEYDVTMSIPLVLDGVDRWPLWWEQPNGERCEWVGTPGTVLIADGRQRWHGRGEFQGTLSAVPHSVEPVEAAVYGDPAQASAAVEASRGRSAVFVALLDGRAALTVGGADAAPDASPDAVALQPGDGVAFPAAAGDWRGCRLRWLEAGRGKALVGRARRARAGA